jgi:hypothetical protein
MTLTPLSLSLSLSLSVSLSLSQYYICKVSWNNKSLNGYHINYKNVATVLFWRIFSSMGVYPYICFSKLLIQNFAQALLIGRDFHAWFKHS